MGLNLPSLGFLFKWATWHYRITGISRIIISSSRSTIVDRVEVSLRSPPSHLSKEYQTKDCASFAWRSDRESGYVANPEGD
jgi:hypothetical protein